MKRFLLAALVMTFAGVTGCSASGRAPASPPASAPPASPVSARATVTGRCVTGIDDITQGTFFPMTSYAGSAPSVQTGDEIAEAYQLTLTDTSPSATAAVTGFDVVFYSGGTELTSDSEPLSAAAFITPGQSLMWTEDPWGVSTAGHEASVGPFAAGQSGAVDLSATCQLVQWSHQ